MLEELNVTEVPQVEYESEKEESFLGSVLRILTSTLLWSMVLTAIASSLIAAVWTLTPTELLDWGSQRANLIGYVSHCNYTPISTMILVGVSIVFLPLMVRLIGKYGLNYGVLTGLAIGLLTGIGSGLSQGRFVNIFIGLGIGVGIGVLLGIVIGLIRRNGGS